MSTTFMVKIDTDSNAFTDSDGREAPFLRAYETARILRGIAQRLSDEGGAFFTYETLLDINGNDVGRAKFVKR